MVVTNAVVETREMGSTKDRSTGLQNKVDCERSETRSKIQAVKMVFVWHIMQYYNMIIIQYKRNTEAHSYMPSK